jgi:DNA-binding MarR family transcriptional regulator
VPDPNDGRGVQVVLTADGRTRVDDALTDLLAHERDILSALPAADRDHLADLLRRLTLPFDTA